MTKSINSVIKNNILLLLFVVCLFFLNYYSKTLFFRPNSIHQWRQADCLSITKNYYEEGMHFFEPKIHYQGPKEGRAVSEFPVLNYTVAALWKVFGEHEFIYRLVEYFIYLTSLFVLFNSLLRQYRSSLIAFFTVGLLLTSPLLTYYSINFIADVPAFSIGIVSLCTFMRFYETKRMTYFYWALAWGLLAVLMKASALIALCLLLFFTLIDLFNLNKFFGTEKLFQRKLVPFLFILITLLLIFSWYNFALIYNDNNSNNIFLLTFLPIWEMDKVQLIYNLKMLFNNLFPLFLNKGMFFLFFVLVLFVIVKFKQLSSFLKYAFVFSGLFFVFYILFFFQVFSVHDYYLSNIMIFPVITLICFAHIQSATSFIESNKSFLRALLLGFMLFNSFHAAAVYRLRTIEKDSLIEWFPFISEDEIKLADYLSWVYSCDIKKLEEFSPELRKYGIQRSDLVLSIPDQSFDISLYFLDQKGFTISRDHLLNDSTVADRFLQRNVKYLILSDTTLKTQVAFKRIYPYLQPMFVKNKVQVFRFKEVR